MKKHEDERFVTIGEAAELLRISVQGVRLLVNSGKLTAVKLPRRYIIDRVDLEKYITERKAS